MSSGTASPKDRAQETASPPSKTSQHSQRYVVLTGNPNCGKTTLFNALTGLRAKVGNYAGVTVERKEGPLLGNKRDKDTRVLDLPGTYSLSPQSLDEQVSRDVLLNRLAELPRPSAVVVVIDASNLQRNLYYATQVIELGYPTIVALNMVDVARQNGHEIDADALSAALGVQVVPTVASANEGIPVLRKGIELLLDAEVPATPRSFCRLPPAFANEVTALSALLNHKEEDPRTSAEALLILSNQKALDSSSSHYSPAVKKQVTDARQRLESGGIDWAGVPIEARYQSVAAIQGQTSKETQMSGESISDKLDRVLTHKVWGTVIFLALMALMFQSIFSFARIPMEAIQSGIDWFGGAVGALIPPGDLNSLIVDGVIAGVGAVVVFLPQILLLFLFIGFLEDTGYMARAAFIMDRMMSKVGLHGKSFIPMLSSFACAVPGIMATRTIESPKDRLVTIMIAPLMSCSARLPVYTLLIAACIPNVKVLGIFKLPGIVMLVMYLLGTVVALIMAWIFKKTLLKGEPPLLILELPPYKRPLPIIVLRHMWDRSKVFLKQAGTIILGINIILWFLASYPRDQKVEQEFAARRATLTAAAATQPSLDAGQGDNVRALEAQASGERLRHSFAGRLGRVIEPVIAPLGFDWRIGIGIISSFAAREVFVSTMSTVYNVGQDAPGSAGLVKTLQEQRRPDGSAFYTPLTGLTLMVFYVFALQCVSTVAVVRRETNSWRWPLFQWVYMGLLAWGFAFAVWRVGHLLGYS